MSSKQVKKSVGPAAERIIEVASDLFFRQGYRATGINEIIEKSGVAKATFYSHYKTKEDLCKVYLEGLRQNELLHVDSFIAAARDPLGRYMAPIRSIEPWLLQTRFRGCPFVNIASEVPDPKSPLRKVGMKVYQEVGVKVRQVCDELVQSTPTYQHLDAASLASTYMLLFTGAISLAELYHEVWPAEEAEKAVAALVEQ